MYRLVINQFIKRWGTFPKTLLAVGFAAFGLITCAFLAWSLAANDAENEVSQTSAGEMAIWLRNISYPPQDPGEPFLNRHYQQRERLVNIPVENAALVLIDVWDVQRDRFDKEEKDTYERITRQKIAPILNAARDVGMVVIHAPHRPIGWDGKNTQTQVPDLRTPYHGASSKVPDAALERAASRGGGIWPPLEFTFRVGDYEQFALNSFPEYMKYPQIHGIHSAVLPQKRNKEYILGSINEFKNIVIQNELLHLFYVGGDVGICILDRPVGLKALSSTGLNLVVIRDAVYDTRFSLLDKTPKTNLEAALTMIEMKWGFTTTMDSFMKWLNNL